MMTKYRLDFRSLETGHTWHGEPIFNTFAAANETAEELNKKHPYTPCWVTAVEVDEPEQPVKDKTP